MQTLQKRKTARRNLNIPDKNKIILSIDGGGMRGIFTLQLLKELEKLAGGPVYEWCDMVAGTSTGAIISGLIAYGKSATEIETLYLKLVSRVFLKNGLLSGRFINPPAFNKKNYRELLKEEIGNVTLEELNVRTGLDMLFTAKDLAAGEETFFTFFNNASARNTYKNVLLRGVMEATMSAPTYFAPFERFVDGGTTTFNNPVTAAIMEALFYSGKRKYKADHLTVFSFGTGTSLRFIKPEETPNPKGADAFFWLNYVLDEASKDASEMQVDMLRTGLIPKLDFRRYQLSLDRAAIVSNKLPDLSIEHIPDLKADSLYELTDEDLEKIDMADVSKFPLMKALGESVAQHICPPHETHLPINKRKANWFQRDQLDANRRRGELVSAYGDPATIMKNLSDPKWVDGQITG